MAGLSVPGGRRCLCYFSTASRLLSRLYDSNIFNEDWPGSPTPFLKLAMSEEKPAWAVGRGFVMFPDMPTHPFRYFKSRPRLSVLR